MRALVALILVAVLAGCAAPQPNRYELEYRAYLNCLDSELKAGRMTEQQAIYLATNKLNQLGSQKAIDQSAKDQALINALGTAAAINRANQPYTLSPPPRQVINCDTSSYGSYSSTECR